MDSEDNNVRWSGWNVINVPSAAGGAPARASARLQRKQRNQLEVLALIARTYPVLISGQPGIEIGPSVVDGWLDSIHQVDGLGAYDIRDRVNFLVLGLERGKKQLGWQVDVPAPYQIVHHETASFTWQSFKQLSEYRDWLRDVQSRIFSDSWLIDSPGNENLNVDALLLSWGHFLFWVITRDALIDKHYLNALPLFSRTLTIYEDRAWLTLFETIPEDLKGKVLPQFIWLPSAVTLSVLMRHCSHYGHPDITDLNQAQAFTQKAWKAFQRKLSVAKPISLQDCCSWAETDARFSVPAYIVNGLAGRHRGTSITQNRWQQLMLGGRRKEPCDAVTSNVPGKTVAVKTFAQRNATPSLADSMLALKALQRFLYKPRNQKRPSFAAVSLSLDQFSASATTLAPVVECLCNWVKSMHLRKLKLSTLHTYVSTVAEHLLLHLGNTPIDGEHVLELTEAYSDVSQQAISEKNRQYRLIVLRQFHQYLISEYGLPDIYIDGRGPESAVIRHQADANLISEHEYQLIKASLSQEMNSAIGQIRYWIFVLGYRAGLRISEALSIQLRDLLFIQRPNVDSEFILLIRPNRYVDLKSYDSRRQIPLHLLLTKEEREAFEQYIRQKDMLAVSKNVMIFALGTNAMAPLQDDEVYIEIHRAMRTITGDSSLRYHHLRHSLANNLLLAFHGIKSPWSGPQHLRPFIEVLSQYPTRSGLYYISQLLGHAGPETTLRSYVHCQNVIAWHYLDGMENSIIGQLERFRHGREQLVTQQLEAFGVKAATIRKWKQRFGSNYVKWLTQAFKTATVKELSCDDVVPFADMLITSIKKRALSELTLPELEIIIERAEVKAPHELEMLLNLETGSYAQWENAYYRILMKPTRKKGLTGFRHIRPRAYGKSKNVFKGHVRSELFKLPQPASEYEQNIAQKIFDGLKAKLLSETACQATKEGLTYFNQYHRAGDGYIWLPNISDAQPFITWAATLAHCGLEIKVTPSSHSLISAERQKAEWTNRFKGSKVTAGDPARLFNNEYGSAQLRFTSPQDKGSVNRGYTVRYVLVMLCVLAAAI